MTVRELSLLTRGLSATAVHQPGGLAPNEMLHPMLSCFHPAGSQISAQADSAADNNIKTAEINVKNFFILTFF